MIYVPSSAHGELLLSLGPDPCEVGRAGGLALKKQVGDFPELTAAMQKYTPSCRLLHLPPISRLPSSVTPVLAPYAQYAESIKPNLTL